MEQTGLTSAPSIWAVKHAGGEQSSGGGEESHRMDHSEHFVPSCDAVYPGNRMHGHTGHYRPPQAVILTPDQSITHKAERCTVPGSALRVEADSHLKSRLVCHTDASISVN